MTVDTGTLTLSIEGNAPKAWQLDQQVRALCLEGQRIALEVGRVLLLIHDGGLYRSLGCDTWAEYIAQPEINIPYRTSYRWMAFARCATVAQIDDAEAVAVGDVKAEIIESFAKEATPERVAEMVASAPALTVSDLHRRIRDETDGPVPDDREWLEEVGQRVISRASKLSRSDSPLNLLDEIVSIGMQGIERLRGRGE